MVVAEGCNRPVPAGASFTAPWRIFFCPGQWPRFWARWNFLHELGHIHDKLAPEHDHFTAILGNPPVSYWQAPTDPADPWSSLSELYAESYAACARWPNLRHPWYVRPKVTIWPSQYRAVCALLRSALAS